MTSAVTGNPLYDAPGTIAIGVLLIGVAIILIFETHSLLVGEGASREVTEEIVRAIEGGPEDSIDRVIHLKTLYLGPDELLVAAKVGVRAADTAAEVSSAIDVAEVRLRASVPVARVIYLEPDVYEAARDEPGSESSGTNKVEGRSEDSVPTYEGLRQQVMGPEDERPRSGA